MGSSDIFNIIIKRQPVLFIFHIIYAYIPTLLFITLSTGHILWWVKLAHIRWQLKSHTCMYNNEMHICHKIIIIIL